jgi:hypothetical protein
MISLNHLFVIPVTGADQGRVCLVCKAQSSPAVVAFIKPEQGKTLQDLDHAMELIEAIEMLDRSDETLRKFVVIKTEAEMVIGPDGKLREQLNEELRQEIIALANQKGFTVPIAVLPAGGLPDTIPKELDMEAENSVMFYRNRQTDAEFVFNSLSFKDRDVSAPPTPSTLLDTTSLTTLTSIPASAPLTTSETFKKLEDVAAKL